MNHFQSLVTDYLRHEDRFSVKQRCVRHKSHEVQSYNRRCINDLNSYLRFSVQKRPPVVRAHVRCKYDGIISWYYVIR